jgi:hypothetical protein
MHQPMPDAISHVVIADSPTDGGRHTRRLLDFCVGALQSWRKRMAVLHRTGGTIDLVRFVPIQGAPLGVVLTTITWHHEHGDVASELTSPTDMWI